jgi:hypothetical protein
MHVAEALPPQNLSCLPPVFMASWLEAGGVEWTKDGVVVQGSNCPVETRSGLSDPGRTILFDPKPLAELVLRKEIAKTTTIISEEDGMKSIKTIFAICLAIFTLVAEAKAASIKNVLLISMDGTQYNHLTELMGAEKLPNLKQLSSEGALSSISIMPFIKRFPSGQGDPIDYADILPEDEIYYEMAVTDSGHAKMLTGERSLINGVFVPLAGYPLIDYIAANNFETVKDGLTVMDKIKAQSRDYYVASVVSRHADMRDHLGKNLYTVFTGFSNSDEIWMPVGSAKAIGGHGFYSTTFLYAEPDLDYFFDPHEIPDSQLTANANNSYFRTYEPMTRRMVSLEELKANFVANKTLEQIAYCSEMRKPFFLFVHFCEPDLFGHFYGENSSEYSMAITTDDAAVGRIINGLKALGVYDETLVIVTTDHGATENSAAATTVEILGKTFLRTLGSLHGALDSDNHMIWMINNKISDMYPMEQIGITPLILDVLGLQN